DNCQIGTMSEQSDEAIIANMKSLMVTIGDLKADMLHMLENDAGLVDCFKATRSESASLAQAVAELETRLGQAIERARSEVLPEVDARLAEYPKVLEQLRSAELVHQAMSVISDIQCRMASLQQSTKEGRYLDCIDEVVALDALFRRDLQLVKEDIQVLTLLRNLFITCKHNLHDAFLSMWSNNFVFKEPLERPLICSLTVRNLANAPKLVRAFQALKLFHSKVDAQLADTLLSRFLLPVISDGSLVLECNAVENQLELVLLDAGQEQQAADGEADVKNDVDDSDSQRRCSRRPPLPLALCACLSPTLDTLREFLLSLPLSDTSEEQQQQSQSDQQPAAMTTLADRLRPLMENQLAERLITDCLAKTVPTDWAGLQAYGETAAAVERLEHQLVVECRLVSPNVSRLGEFVREIGVVFAEKRIAAILEAGREIAARSLADSALVDEAAAQSETGMDAIDFGDCIGGGKEAVELIEKYIDRRTFAFPTCRVSQSAIDLVEYIGQICREASATAGDGVGDSSDGAARGEGAVDGKFSAELRCRIGQCCRKLLLLYRDTASLIHAEQLASVPQLAALYYNNCHYLAHCAVDIEHRFVGPLVSGRGSNPPPKCLVDAAAALRADGARIFLAQLARQRDLILEPASQLTVGQQSSGGSYEANNRLCRQSLYQLECLARVWSVLPTKICCKALGALAHCLLAQLTSFTLAQEDFDCRDADDLARIFQWVQERLAKVFNDAANGSASLERCAPGWPRFCLLGRMLSAPLAAFPDLWCDGKSPLADAFSDAEVRGIVKALFTNTDDRAAVLAKIN
ncbi:hypothetical protein BOX15_Mlig009553g1, partial [Macrostomum lignano]